MKRAFLIELGYLLIGISITFLLCVSSWNFSVEHVDESELTYHAVGFLGGDLDPYWYGYGSFPMYILGGIYWLIGNFYVFIGKFESIESYASQLLFNGHHTSVARYIFCFFSVYGTLIYVRTGRKLKIPWPFMVFLFIGFILAEDALVYANYLRVDQIVSLWVSVLIAIYVFVDKSNSFKLYYIISVIGLAVVSKVSAITLMPVFLFILLIEPHTKTEKFKRLCVSGLLFIIITLVLQPYNNIILAAIYNITTHAQPNDISLIGGFGNSQFSLIDRLTGLIEILNNNLSTLFLAPIVLFPFVYRLDKHLFYFVLILILCTTLPLLLSIKTIEYWFLPSFSLVRFASVLSIYALYRFIQPALPKQFILLVLTLLLINFSYHRIKRYKLVTNEITRSNNIVECTSWIESEILGSSNILIDDLWYTNLPKIYGNSNIDEARNISRLFIYDRYQNEFLNQVFDNFYAKYIGEHYSKNNNLYSVRLQSVLDRNYMANPSSTYFLVSPNTYNVFVQDTDSIFEMEPSYFERRSGYLELFNNSVLITKFDRGTGGVIEVYKLNSE